MEINPAFFASEALRSSADLLTDATYSFLEDLDLEILIAVETAKPDLLRARSSVANFGFLIDSSDPDTAAGDELAMTWGVVRGGTS